MMLELDPIQNVSLAALHARRKEIRARLFAPARLPAAEKLSPPRLSWTPNNRPSFLPPRPLPTPSHQQDTADAVNAPNVSPEPALPRAPNIKYILAQVARSHNVTVEEITSSSRNARFVLARQIACYLAKCLTNKSLPQIGRRIGGRDHTTVLHSIRKIERMITADQINLIRQNFIQPEQNSSVTATQDAPRPAATLPHAEQPSNKANETRN